MLKWPDKDPDEVADYMVDWTARLDGDSIVSSVWIVPAGLVQDQALNEATSTTIWLSGGAAGATYVLVSRVFTAGNRTLEESISLKVTSPVPSLVSLSQVKQTLRIDHEDDDATLMLYINAATNAVVAYLKDPSLLSVSSPPDAIDERVIASIIMVVGYWYRAPDNNNDGAFERGYLPMPITAMLYPMRDPTLA